MQTFEEFMNEGRKIRICKRIEQKDVNYETIR